MHIYIYIYICVCVYSCIIYISSHILLIIFPSKTLLILIIYFVIFPTIFDKLYFLQIMQSFYPKFDDIKDYLPLLFFFFYKK